MTREIKFRVWNTAAKCFYPRDHFGLDMDGIELQKMVACEHHHEVFSRNRSGQEAMIFMQYTGLKDSEGKEIYEGDIVKYTEKMDEGGGAYSKQKGRGIVKFDQHWGVKFDDFDNKTNHTAKYWDLTALHVIGNIYENQVAPIDK